MNVASLCKQVPAYLPHELLGYETDSLKGTLLSSKLISRLNELEIEASNEKTQKQSSRRSKFNKLK